MGGGVGGGGEGRGSGGGEEKTRDKAVRSCSSCYRDLLPMNNRLPSLRF